MTDALFMMIAGTFWILFVITVLYCWIIIEIECDNHNEFKIIIVSIIYLIVNSVLAGLLISAGYHDYILMRG